MESLGFFLLGGGAAWIAYMMFGYPALMWLWGRLRPCRHAADDGFRPTVAVLVAARNEVKDIGWKIRETLEWDYPPELLRVLVASDASDDGTDEVVREIRDPRVRLVRMPTRGGKVRALNRLIEDDASELLVFTDANARVGPEVLKKLVRHFADARVGCVTGRTVCVDQAGPIGAGASVYWDYESLVAGIESRAGAVLVCDGALHAVRRSAIRKLTPHLANDLEAPVLVRAQGYLTLFDSGAIAREVETASAREEFSRRRRICGQGALALWELKSLLGAGMAWQFVSRKLLRWLVLVPLLLLLGGSALVVREPFFAAFLVLQLAFYATAVAAQFFCQPRTAVPRVLAVPYYVVFGAAGAFRGVLDTLAGRRFHTWEVPALSRGR